MEEKKMNRFDVACGFVCALLFVDLIATNASAGANIIGWWIIFAVLVMLPHSFITSELSTTYPEQGGVYAWTKRAYGPKMAARVSYIYWINNALWMPSALIWISGSLCSMFFPEMTYWNQVALCVVLIWVCIGICSLSIEESKWSSNFSAIAKIVVSLLVIVAGFVVAFRGDAAANSLTFKDMLPSFSGGEALIYVPSAIYLCFGADVLSSNVGKMKNPKKDIPKSIIWVCLGVVAVYVLSTWSLLYTIPLADINLITAPTDLINIAFGSEILSKTAGILINFALITSVILYVLGTSVSMSEAGKDGEFPKVFAIESKKTGAPTGVLILTGILASITIVIYGFMAGGSLEDLFFIIFAFTSVLYFIPFILMHSAYRKLKKLDPQIERPYTAPLGKICSVICQIALIGSMILFVVIPGEPVDWLYTGSVLGGIIITIIAGEIMLKIHAKKHK